MECVYVSIVVLWYNRYEEGRGRCLIGDLLVVFLVIVGDWCGSEGIRGSWWGLVETGGDWWELVGIFGGWLGFVGIGWYWWGLVIICLKSNIFSLLQ